MKILTKELVIVFIISFIIVLAVYWQLFFTFYQQDEWQGVGFMQALGFGGYITSGFSPIQVFFGQSRIFTAAINYILFQMIPFNVFFLALYALIMHSINTTLVYSLASRFFKNIFIAAICALFFCLNNVGSQAVSWFGTSVAALTASTFILVSLLFLLEYLEKEKNIFLWISYLTLIVSFYFKESGLGFIPFYTILLLFYKRKKMTSTFVIKAAIPLLYFICFAIFRYVTSVFTHVKTVGYITSSSPQYSTLLFNGFRSFLIIFGQVLVPPNLALFLGNTFLPIVYPKLLTLSGSDLIIQTIGIDFLMTVISFVFLILLFLFIRSKGDLQKAIFFFIIVLVSLVPYIVISPGWSYFESRYYYVPIIGMSLLVGSFSVSLVSFKKRYISGCFFLLFLILLIIHVKYTYSALSAQIQLAKDRLFILSSIKREIPRLNRKTVFYISSVSTYTVPHNPLPFQQGLGYTLQVWLFNKSNDKLKILLTEPFLWDLGSEGYQQVGDQGFGYFYSLDDLKGMVKKYKLNPNVVYAFSWDGNTHQLTNITQQTRKKLK